MPRLSMRFLGSFAVQLDGEPVAGLEYDKARALLAYLALETDRPHRRQTLAGLLWPDLSERRARHNLSQALYVLRTALKSAGSSCLHATPDTIQFAAEVDHWIDVTAFTSLLADCTAHPHWRLKTCPTCRPLLARAVALYGGAFMEGLSLPDAPAFEEWQLVWRERLHHQATDALRTLAYSYDHDGDRAAALGYAQQWVALDPWHEEAQRQLMRALALHGRRSAALVQYERCCHTLEKELGVPPVQETVALYQTIRSSETLPDLYPPLPNNLPAQTTPFLGRRVLLDGLRDALRDPACRLVTLVGPGGSGKTRLALQAGGEAAAQAPALLADGVWFVSLASLRVGESIATALIQALGYGVDPGVDPAAALLRALRDKRLLLILDNYEHLLGENKGPFSGVRAVIEILRAAPDVQILVTSRVRLNVLAERVLFVGGMSFPSHREEGDETQHSAVALFAERVRAIRPSFVHNGVTRAQVGRICRLVEGMPLAIVLAASWADVLSLDEIADRIAQGLEFLRADWADLPQRQRSMRAVFDASWQGLSKTEQAAFPALAVFRGSFALQGARAVSGATVEVMGSLLRTSFVARQSDSRFEIHELLRQYGEGKLRERSGGVEAACDAHCRYYARYFADLAPEMWRQGLGEAAPELENLLAAWRWAVQRGDVAALSAFVGRELASMYQIYVSLSMFAQGRADFGRAVAALRTCEPTPECTLALALALRGLSILATRLGQRRHDQDARQAIEESIAILERLGVEQELALSQIWAAIAFGYDPGALRNALRLCRRIGYTYGIAWACHLLGGGAMYQGRYDEAEPYLREALHLMQITGHIRGTGWVVRSLGALARIQGQHAQAKAYYQQSFAAFQSTGARGYATYDLNWLGDVALEMGDYGEARQRYQEARKVAQDLSDRTTLAIAIAGLGDTARAEGDATGAEAYYRQALAVSDVPNINLRPHILLRQARQVAEGGDVALGVELTAIALHRPLADDETRARAQHLLDELRGQLSHEAYAAAVESGVAQAPMIG
jgi:predicted ATPase/DNA-binding SARP family transcriptional activator